MFFGLLNTCTTANLGGSLTFNTEGRIKLVAINNRTYRARFTLVNTNSNESLYYPFTVSLNMCGGTCKIIMIYTYARSK